MTWRTPILRALFLRCPRCGGDRIFSGMVAMNERCGGCDHPFSRENGYFLGSIYVNYALTGGLGLILHIIASAVFEVPVETQMKVLLPLYAVMPFVFFRWSRALFMAMDIVVDPPPAPQVD